MMDPTMTPTPPADTERPASPQRPSKAQAVYFSCPDDEPPVSQLIFALEGVCSTLDADAQDGFNDFDHMCRIGNLATAARILASQLLNRMTAAPPPRRRRAS
jgi:hypothetical protein